MPVAMTGVFLSNLRLLNCVHVLLPTLEVSSGNKKERRQTNRPKYCQRSIERI